MSNNPESAERRSLNGMWHKSKGKLILLRLACGLDSHSRGEVTRDHIYVPNTPGNAMLDCAEIMVEEGLMERYIDNGSDVIFNVTDKGIERAKARYANPPKSKLKDEDVLKFDRIQCYNWAMTAKDLIMNVREQVYAELSGLQKAPMDCHKFALGKVDLRIDEALRSVGEMCYQLLNEVGKKEGLK